MNPTNERVQNILETYRGEWLLFEILSVGEHSHPDERQLVWHSTDRNEIYEKVRALQLKHFQVLFSGELVPEGCEVAL